MKTLNIQGLDFDSIKANFITFLQNDGKYNSFNFLGSNINALLNIFGYATHYIGYYVKMALSEAFIDSASQLSSMYSKAKLTGYLPKGMGCATAQVNLQITTTTSIEPSTRAIIIPKYSYFSGNNVTGDSRNFYVLDNVNCYNRTVNGTAVAYTSPNFLVYEGTLKQWNFLTDATILNQRFVIQDTNLDVNTLRVSCYLDGNPDNRTDYIYAKNMIDINSQSTIFYVTTSAEGYYEIYFGNGLFGIAPDTNTIVECTYISTTGDTGNGCYNMIYQQPSITNNNQTTGFYSNFITTIIQTSQGGSRGETIEDLRFNIPNNYVMQDRVVTDFDYQAMLLQQYPNIDSINVWGGENNLIKQYGTAFVSIKPKDSLVLSSFQKNNIQLMLRNYNVSGIPIIFKDPEYLKINLNITVKYDSIKTNMSANEIEGIVLANCITYNNLYLDKFNSGLSDFTLLEYIVTGVDYIKSIYDNKTFSKDITLTYLSSLNYTPIFGNQLVFGSVSTTFFTYAGIVCYIRDDSNGKLFIYNTTNNTLVLQNSIGTVDYNTGIINFILNLDIISATDYGDGTGLLTINCTPAIPDVTTYMNNILLLDTINVTAIAS